MSEQKQRPELSPEQSLDNRIADSVISGTPTEFTMEERASDEFREALRLYIDEYDTTEGGSFSVKEELDTEQHDRFMELARQGVEARQELRPVEGVTVDDNSYFEDNWRINES